MTDKPDAPTLLALHQAACEASVALSEAWNEGVPRKERLALNQKAAAAESAFRTSLLAALPEPSADERSEAERIATEVIRDWWDTRYVTGQGYLTEALAKSLETALSRARASGRAEMREEAAKWQPIETAPKDGTFVLVANELAVGEASYYEDDDGWWWANTHPTDATDGKVWNPTHWQPLPPPPVTPDGARTQGEE